jgi:hypothetical protein
LSHFVILQPAENKYIYANLQVYWWTKTAVLHIVAGLCEAVGPQQESK